MCLRLIRGATRRKERREPTMMSLLRSASVACGAISSQWPGPTDTRFNRPVVIPSIHPFGRVLSHRNRDAIQRDFRDRESAADCGKQRARFANAIKPNMIANPYRRLYSPRAGSDLRMRENAQWQGIARAESLDARFIRF